MLVPFLQRKNIFNTHDENLVGGFCFTPLVNAGAINATFLCTELLYCKRLFCSLFADVS